MLVDTSIWIDYFKSGDKSEKLDFLIDENLVVTNELILTELLPPLILRKEIKLVSLLEKTKQSKLRPNWKEIIEFQVICLKSGSNGIGIPDLIIAQNAIQNDLSAYSTDKHFKFMYEANFGMKLYI